MRRFISSSSRRSGAATATQMTATMNKNSSKSTAVTAFPAQTSSLEQSRQRETSNTSFGIASVWITGWKRMIDHSFKYIHLKIQAQDLSRAQILHYYR